MKFTRPLGLLLLAAVLLAACAPGTASVSITPSQTPAGLLTPFLTYTPQPSTTPTPPGTATPLPTPTPAPLQHVLTNSDTLFGLALRYGVSLDAILKINPGINPNALKVGSTILIPPSTTPVKNAETIPTPTPVAVQPQNLHCAPTPDGGAWCFWLVKNTQSFAVENVTGQIRLADMDARQFLLQTASAPLNRLLPGQELPLVAYFPPPVPQPFQTAAELSGALPVPAKDSRYLAASLENIQITIDSGGLSAQAKGVIKLNAPGKAAQRIWVAAVAYDADGQVIGVRRWESTVPTPGDRQAAFDMYVYSTGGEISRVELLVEAQP